jgi:hypothetical protein
MNVLVFPSVLPSADQFCFYLEIVVVVAQLQFHGFEKATLDWESICIFAVEPCVFVLLLGNLFPCSF